MLSMVAFFCILESMKHSFTPISKIGRTAVLQKLNEFQGASSIPINLLGKKKTGLSVSKIVELFGDKTQLYQQSLQLIEGIHFDLTYTPLEHIGFKAVSLFSNQCYAENGRPISLSCDLSIPNKVSVEMIQSIMSGVNKGCIANNIVLDQKSFHSNSSQIIIHVHGIAIAQEQRRTSVDNVQTGDAICVSGDVGAAIAGLRILMREKKFWQESGEGQFQPDLGDYEYVIQRQLMPKSRMDIIDRFDEFDILPTSISHLNMGVINDVAHLCEKTGLGAHIYQATLPIAIETRQVADEMEEDVDKYAYFGGEDAELLFTLNEEDADRLFTLFKDFTVIGRMTEVDSALTIQTSDGEILHLDDMKG